jgi:hypothetical protein
MAPIQNVDPKDLSSAGWGVIFAPDIGSEIREALGPLLRRRQEQAGVYFKVYVYKNGQTKQDFLAAQGAGPGPADPRRVPYYLLIVGDPRTIPFRFQYELDVQYAVGRIHFDFPEDYAIYARSIVDTEAGKRRLPRKDLTLFGTAHPDDAGTRQAAEEFLPSLAEDLQGRSGWRVHKLLGQPATKKQLRQLLGKGNKPALLFTATHGVSFPPDDPEMLRSMGSILCQDWPGPKAWQGRLPRNFYFMANDLDNEADLSGMIVFFVGSNTAGTPEFNDYEAVALENRSRIAPYSFVSPLAKRLLAHPSGGALAAIGHVDRLLSASFSWYDEEETEKAVIFSSTIKRLLDGHTVGSAMEYINQRHAELSVEASGLWAVREGRENEEEVRARIWRALSDVRNWIVLGDPAVRLTAQDFPERTVGAICGASNDTVATEDQLGFNYYVKAFCDLIESTHTQLPLTVGIFGSWGMGKSFLLEHIEKELKSRQEGRSGKSITANSQEPVVSRIHTVTFNAWEYSASEAIWPGLVRKIMDRLEKEVSWPFPGRFLTKFWLNLKAQIKRERIRIGTVLYLAVIAAIAAFLLWSGKFPQTWKALVAAGIAGLAGGLLKLVSDTVANPLSQWLTKLFLEDDYGRHIGNLARIRKDLEFLEGRLRTDPKKVERVLILIDDLDRCEPEKAVEMLQAVKLLLDFESFILFLGIDARIITRAIEKHYQGLLGEAGASGYEYLDKIVQIPFQIPAPAKDQVKEFLRHQMGDPRPSTDKPAAELAPPVAEDLHAEATPLVPQEGQEVPVPAVAPALPLPEEPSAGLTAFTLEELQAFQSMADCLRPNPRHLKRLVNVYRLVRTLADLTGERTLLEKPGATICWVVLCAQWPRTAHRMLRRLDELEGRREKEKDFKFPEADPLRHLLADAERAFATSPPQRSDSDPTLLHRLVDCDEARMSWGELRSIRRYTINFNPAIEVESSAEERPSLRPAEAGGRTEVASSDTFFV